MSDFGPQPTPGAPETHTYPPPLIIPPFHAKTHTHSIILLHGRGSSATPFGLELLRARSSTGLTLATAFPTAKFIFPTASKRRAVALQHLPINQWFDIYSLVDPSQRQDLQYDGLRESGAFIADILQKEVDAVGARNVILGGLSQGCAMGLHVLLSYPFFSRTRSDASSPEYDPEDGDEDGAARGEGLAGFVGMSGWLPFQGEIADAGRVHGFSSHPFSTTDADPEPENLTLCPQLLACNLVRNVASLPPLPAKSTTITSPSGSQASPLWSTTPVFLGHGTADEKVSVTLGESTRDVLTGLGIDVTWKGYRGFGHWYKEPDEIDDIIAFIEETVGWKKT